MKSHTRTQRIDELERCLRNGHISLATRRAMDICTDFRISVEERQKVTAVRAEYNRLRGLGEGELQGEKQVNIVSALEHFLEHLRSLPEEEIVESRKGEDLLSAQGLVKRFSNAGHNFELGPLDLNLASGAITGVVGENGNGKTTLLRMLAMELSNDGGTLDYSGVAVDPLNPYRIRQRIAFIPQRLTPWFGTLLENLQFAAAIHGIRGEANHERVDFIIHRLGLTRFQHLTWKQLSSGYKLRFELAKMIVWRPSLLVLDEPIANLDLNAQQLFLQDLTHLVSSSRHPMSIILSSQQLHEIEEVSDNIIFLRNGKSLYTGSTKAFGEGRTQNSFEVAGEFEAEQLAALLSAYEGARMEENGVSFTLHLPMEVSSDKLLQLLVDKRLKISYFRDISLSTRKLLSDTA